MGVPKKWEWPMQADVTPTFLFVIALMYDYITILLKRQHTKMWAWSTKTVGHALFLIATCENIIRIRLAGKTGPGSAFSVCQGVHNDRKVCS